MQRMQRIHKQSLFMAFALILCFLGLVAIASTIYASITETTPRQWVDHAFGEEKKQPVPAEPENFRFRNDINAEEAEQINAAIAESTEPVIPAAPFKIPHNEENAIGRLTAIDCLTSAVYYEAANESITGQRAVAQVVLNRVKHPAYPNSVCGVVFQGSERRTGCQFSYTCDGSLARRPSQSGWARSRAVAAMALSGYVEHSVGLATHYHANYVVPYWSANLTKIQTIGTHIFYRWTGNSGKRNAFNSRYAHQEQPPEKLAFALSDMLLSTIVDPKNAESVSEALVDQALSDALITKVSEEKLDTPLQKSEGLLPAPTTSVLPDKGKLMADDNPSALHIDDKKTAVQ
jgi:spore germination cell wall hydrolase CwlJ-like protein